MFKGFFSALSFLTIIPVPGKMSGSSDDLGESIVFFPVVGLFIGLATAISDSFLFCFFPPLVRSVLCMFFMVSISKGLHLDGLADTADGFLSSRPRDRILEIMRDSRIGTMGAAALVSIMLLKTSALFSLNGDLRTRALVMAPIAGRCSMSIIMTFFRYARKDGGLASVFYEKATIKTGIVSALFFAIAGLSINGLSGFFISSAAIAFIYLWGLCSKRMIGGFTGDTLGAGCELTEAFALVCFSMIG
ncbi:adenosylcobinamide-GDP ribazoletransferase [Desulforegula conservatrix]|uniref:adenosylcobinamide-GDP ribazoletransferase n=1 Tax=Desulforegula conservatrix TaxID=153026 RepID=UPI000419FCBC|nr:adenosylcobinamide-GDP ribazoletransferase [Desulforegula conservatrix]